MTEHVQVRKDFYAIALSLAPPLSSRDTKPSEVYFKADRYSPYSGRLQVDWSIESAQKFKTEKGALSALGRLIAKGTLNARHKPRVVRYTETLIQKWEEIVSA